MKTKIFTSYAFAMIAGRFMLTSCSDDDDVKVNNGSTGNVSADKVSFVVTSGDPENDLAGGVGLRVFTDLTEQKSEQEVYTDESGNTLKVLDTFTQVTYNSQSGTFTGYVYARGASAEGIGSMQAGLRSYKIDGGKTVEIGEPVKLSNFGNTGVYGAYSYAAQISNPYSMVLSRNGESISDNNVAIDLPYYAIEGTTPTITNIVDMGNNQVAMVLNYANRDSAAVAIADYDLNISSVIFDGRIGVSMGAMRSVRYSLSGADDNGNVYIFSGNSDVDSRVGALKINKGATTFDSDYYFDILSKADGYRFRKAFHISGDYFLLEFYNEKDAYANMSASGKMAVVKMGDQSLTWVTGLPDMTTVSIGWGDGYDGVFYLPLAAPTEMSGSGNADAMVLPTIYAIDAATGKASARMTFKSTELLKAVTVIK